MSSTNLYLNISKEQWPIIYRKEYNVNFMGLEKLHPFDAHKWKNVYKFLNEEGLINEKTVVVPNEATKEDLLMVHSKRYLKKLNCSLYVAKIAEVFALVVVPNCLVQSAYLRPMRFQTGGSILAGKLALDRGWAINIGGGFHHCCATKGGGFCAYADITLLVKFLFFHFPRKVRRVLIVDLDAHQGNGYERDFKGKSNVYIMDVFNKWIYPWDTEAKKAIRKKVELDFFVSDESYLKVVKRNLTEALAEFDPQIMIYNAGTDILKGDKLGGMSISEKGIIKRDELVFREAISRSIPIVMLTSGGYLKKTAKVIADSIVHLYKEGLIHGPQEYYF
ncbi:histone deacetylase 11 [Anoplophora glabripennis]|uniref:histone deacetylase 11 n=1 Tax=Anoplophora glabripennis TaxID=217634 RepID=UPI0008742D34|nr:histone deacetylase 11 [Anoplophora glabripennis]XP_018565271.1 histone deacetylase 11 [Anoplophora glabripennis]XP_018565272.1 histone deacetylase 11 [Anoplophora glabripennis]